MADVVFDDEEQMRGRRAVAEGGSSIVNYLIRKKIAKTRAQANVYIVAAIVGLYVGALYFADRGGVLETGISSIGEEESVRRPPWEAEQLESQ